MNPGCNELNKSLLNKLINVSVFEIMDDFLLSKADLKVSIDNANLQDCENFG